MTLQAAILIGLKSSIMLLVFALGLRTTAADVTYLYHHPHKLVRSLIAMDLIMPAFAIIAIAALPSLPGPVKIALAALSLSPIPPALPKKTTQMGGTEAYMISLLVCAAIIALVFVPLATELMGVIFGVDTHISFFTVASLMVMTILGPLAAGIFVRNNWPSLAEWAARPLGQIAGVLLPVCALPIIVTMWPQMQLLIGDGTLAVFALFVGIGLAVGHVLGGPEPGDRTVLAITSASRHPGVAIAIAAASFPDQKLASAAVVLYLIVSALASFPYVFWRKRRVQSLLVSSAGAKSSDEQFIAVSSIEREQQSRSGTSWTKRSHNRRSY